MPCSGYEHGFCINNLGERIQRPVSLYFYFPFFQRLRCVYFFGAYFLLYLCVPWLIPEPLSPAMQELEKELWLGIL